jgi:hypothetical protein
MPCCPLAGGAYETPMHGCLHLEIVFVLKEDDARAFLKLILTDLSSILVQEKPALIVYGHRVEVCPKAHGTHYP